MAEESAAEKTEQPTPERLRKAREEGRVPESKEAPTATMVLALLLALVLMAGRLYNWFAGVMGRGLAFVSSQPMDNANLLAACKALGAGALVLIAPVLLIAVGASVLSSLISSGWTIAPSALKLKWERLSPVNGLKNLFSARSLVRLVVSVAKVTLILLIVFFYLRGRLEQILTLRWASPQATLGGIAHLVLGVGARITVGLLLIALIDVLYQRWQYIKQLRMTRQQVKEERKQHEVSPEVRGRIRAVQIEMARKRMLQEVPTADVVVTNPTHVAVALKYEAATMDAPQVVAKGPDLLAEKIKEIARTHGVPIVQRPELARTIFATVEVGQPIPETLFVAVAEVLAMIYRLRGRRPKSSGNRPRA